MINFKEVIPWEGGMSERRNRKSTARSKNCQNYHGWRSTVNLDRQMIAK